MSVKEEKGTLGAFSFLEKHSFFKPALQGLSQTHVGGKLLPLKLNFPSPCAL